MDLNNPSGDRRRFAVIGLGYWGPNLVRVLSEIERVEIAWIADTNVDRVERLRHRYPAARGTTRIEDIFEDGSVDAVLIATPVFTHFDLALRSLQAGKHTFVEKPLAASGAMAEELATEAHSRGLVLMCGHTFLYSPPVQALKQMLQKRELGDLCFISSSRVNLGLHQRDVSVVWDLGPHDFSILLYWLEEMPVTVAATGRDCVVAGIPDVAFVTLTFPSGLIARIELSWLAPSKLRQTVVVGREKMVVYSDGSPEPIRVFDNGVVYRDPETFGEYHLSYRTGDIVTPRLETFEPLNAELADFVRAIDEGDPMDRHIALAQNVVRLTDAADTSLRHGGTEVHLDPHPDSFPHPRRRWSDVPSVAGR